MATISSTTSGSHHWNDPVAWIGGVVPGKADTAIIQSTFTLINEGSGLHYWTGSIPDIQVDSTTGFPATSGSFFTYTDPGVHKVKISYDSLDSNQFFNCSISTSYANPKGESPTWMPGITGSFVGIIRNNTPVFREDHTKIYLSGSSEWHIYRPIVRDQASFIIKDYAHLALDSDIGDSYIEVEDGDLQILGHVTCSLTGSTERNSGLVHHDNFHYGTILVSGSSDLRNRTSVTVNSPAGVGYLTVADASGFGEGDFISVYHQSKDDHYINISPDGNNETSYYQYGSGSDNVGASGTDGRYSASFVFPRAHRRKYKDNNETLQVVSTATNRLYVKKQYAKDGKVVSTTSFTKDQYLRQKGNVSNFTGANTSITVRSGHNSFVEGDKIVTDTGVVATIRKVRDKLIPYKNIDFATDTDPLQHFMIDPYIGSGSSVDYATTSHLITGSFGLTITTGSDSSGFHDDYGTSDSRYRRIFLKDDKLRDVKVTISASQFGGHRTSWDSDLMCGVQIRQCPYLRTRVRPFYSAPDDSQGPYIGIYSDDVYFGTEPDDYLQVDTDNSPFSGTPQRTTPSTMTIDAVRLESKYYWNGHHLGTTKTNHQAGGVTLSLRGYGATIRSMVVEEYVQEILLDTPASIPAGTSIYKTGTLVPHLSDQKIVKIAHTIKDTRGYKNLGAAYAEHLDYKNPSAIADITIPTFWSNQGDLDLYQSSTTTDSRARVRALFELDGDYDLYFRTSSSGDRYFELNFGKQITFDAVSICGRYFASYNSRTATLNGFGVEYSNDGHTWTVAKAQANDTRKPRGQSGHRLFTFSAVTARFIRIRVNGGSASSNNYISHLGIYHFNGRGSTLELHNTLGLEVGNTISIINHLADPGGEYAMINYGEWRTGAKNGSETTDDYVGGWDHNYKITAIAGNVITLDRNIEGQLVFKDDIIVKLDRSITVKTDNYIPFGPYYSNSNDEQHRVEYYNAAFMSMGRGSRELWRWYSHATSANAEFSNCTFNHIERASNYQGGGGMVMLNNAWINVENFSERSYRRYSNNTHHGNIIYGYYILPRVMLGMQTHSTGNLNFASRYILFHYHSGPEQNSNLGLNVIRNNYYKFTDYIEFDPNDVGTNSYNTKNMEFHDNKFNFGCGPNYYRDIAAAFDIQLTPHKFEYMQAYPFVYPNAIRQWSRLNLPINSQRSGNDGGGTATLITRDPNSYFQNHVLIGENRGAIFQKPGTKDEYQFLTLHHNRNVANVAEARFSVLEEQTVRINISIEHYEDIGSVKNQRSTTNSQFYLMVVGPDARTIGPGTLMPNSETYTTFTFEKTFTATPGEYLVILNKFSYFYSGVAMYFKDMSCLIKGSKPNKLHIMKNGFFNWQLINNPDKMYAKGGHTIGNETTLDNPQRTTIRFRKIRF